MPSTLLIVSLKPVLSPSGKLLTYDYNILSLPPHTLTCDSNGLLGIISLFRSSTRRYLLVRPVGMSVISLLGLGCDCSSFFSESLSIAFLPDAWFLMSSVPRRGVCCVIVAESGSLKLPVSVTCLDLLVICSSSLFLDF